MLMKERMVLMTSENERCFVVSLVFQCSDNLCFIIMYHGPPVVENQRIMKVAVFVLYTKYGKSNVVKQYNNSKVEATEGYCQVFYDVSIKNVATVSMNRPLSSNIGICEDSSKQICFTFGIFS